MSLEVCANCRFWDNGYRVGMAVPDAEQMAYWNGHCRRRAPTRGGVDWRGNPGEWPSVQGGGWCGEWEQIKAGQP